MVIYVWKYQNDTFTRTAVIDYATSVIWVRRFNDAGEFELYIQASAELINLFTGEIFLTRDDNETVMYVEKIQIDTNPETGNYMTIWGRSAECLLENRIIYPQWNYSGKVENGIWQLITQNVTAASNTTRRMSCIRLGALSNLPKTFNKQITGKDLLTAISEICKGYDYGFKMTFNGQYLYFTVYEGTNHSYGQTANPYVVFSPAYENLANTQYNTDKTTHYNYVFVAGEGQGTARTVAELANPAENVTGIKRREKWVDSRNTSRNDGEISINDYMSLLYTQAYQELGTSKETQTFSGEIFDSKIFVAGVDYDLGDTVQIENEYGIKGTAVVTEITDVEDGEGFRRYPTLSEWSV